MNAKTNSLFNWVTIGTIFVTYFVLIVLFPYSSGYRETYRPLIISMQSLYRWDNGEWMFGYAIIPIVSILFWFTRDRYSGLQIKPTYWGLVLIAFSFICYYAGHQANEKYLGFISCQILTAGLILWFLGAKHFKVAFWLWVLLALVWPIIPLIPMISFPLRMIVTKITVIFLNLIGLETIQNGTALVSAATDNLNQGEKFSLQVAAPCSGLRSLMALFMIALGLAYKNFTTEWKRIVFLVSVFPLAIFGNFIRLLILLAGTLSFGSEFAIGKGEHDPSYFHLGAGFLVYIIAIFGLLWIQNSLLNKKKKSMLVKRNQT